MIGLLCFVVAVLASAFKSKIRLEAENASLRHQLVVLRRQVKGRAHLTNSDRWFLVQRASTASKSRITVWSLYRKSWLSGFSCCCVHPQSPARSGRPYGGHVPHFL